MQLSGSRKRFVFIHPFQLQMQRGIEVYLWNLALAFSQSGIEITILTWDGDFDIPEYARHPSLRILRVPQLRYYQAAFAVPFYIFHLLVGNYSHVFVNFAGYGEGGALRISRLFRPIEFSLVCHFPPSQVPHRYREFARWNFQKDARHLIAVSRATANEVEAWSGRSCAIIGHGVDTQRFQPNSQARLQIRQQLNLPPDAPVLISVAALEERKGIQWVIEAMPKVLEKFSSACYWILGNGPHRAALEKRVYDLDLQHSVIFFGFQKDVAPYLVASDVALLLSRGEASPVSLLEFAASGLPIITSRHDPFPELTQPDWSQMVSEKNTNEVAQAVTRLLSNVALRKQMGQAARKYVTKYYQWKRVAEQYCALIETQR